MKKRLVLFLSLVLAACLLSSCAYLPFEGLTGMLGMNDQLGVVDNGETVTISKELYEKYQQFDKLIEMQEIAEYYFYEEVDPQKLMELVGAATADLIVE